MLETSTSPTKAAIVAVREGTPNPQKRGVSTYSLADLSSVVLFGIALFFLTRGLALVLVNGLRFYFSFGFHSVMLDFYLHRFLVFSMLPFGFNLAFGLAFGLRYVANHQTLCERGHISCVSATFWSVFNPALIAFLLWWLLFNVPAFLQPADPYHLFPSWPPHSLYPPVRMELVLFFPLGNKALIAGFLGGIGWQRLRGLLEANKLKIR